MNSQGSRRNEAYIWTSETPSAAGVHQKYYLPDGEGYWNIVGTIAGRNVLRSGVLWGCVLAFKSAPKCGFLNGRGTTPPHVWTFYAYHVRPRTAPLTSGLPADKPRPYALAPIVFPRTSGQRRVTVRISVASLGSSTRKETFLRPQTRRHHSQPSRSTWHLRATASPPTHATFQNKAPARRSIPRAHSRALSCRHRVRARPIFAPRSLCICHRVDATSAKDIFIPDCDARGVDTKKQMRRTRGKVRRMRIENDSACYCTNCCRKSLSDDAGGGAPISASGSAN